MSLASKKVNLKCIQKNDAFTVSNITNGNGALTYPIGLITTDEAVLAGGSSINSNYYLYSGSSYWTFSPNYFNGSSVSMCVVSDSGDAGSSCTVNSHFGSVRPVLNLSPDVLNNGDGSMNDPYHL